MKTEQEIRLLVEVINKMLENPDTKYKIAATHAVDIMNWVLEEDSAFVKVADAVKKTVEEAERQEQGGFSE